MKSFVILANRRPFANHNSFLNTSSHLYVRRSIRPSVAIQKRSRKNPSPFGTHLIARPGLFLLFSLPYFLERLEGRCYFYPIHSLLISESFHLFPLSYSLVISWILFPIFFSPISNWNFISINRGLVLEGGRILYICQFSLRLNVCQFSLRRLEINSSLHSGAERQRIGTEVLGHSPLRSNTRSHYSFPSLWESGWLDVSNRPGFVSQCSDFEDAYGLILYYTALAL